MFSYQSAFESGLEYTDFLDKFGSPFDQSKWERTFDQTEIPDDIRDALNRFKRQMPVICMAGAWCGDCAVQCPIFEKFARLAPAIQLRFVDRDQDAGLQQQLDLCGAPRVPQVVFLSEDFHPVARYGDRTLAKYKSMAETISGAVCSIGIVNKGDALQDQVLREWFDQFHRAQLILRTSPRLRQLHGD